MCKLLETQESQTETMIIDARRKGKRQQPPLKKASAADRVGHKTGPMS